MKKLILAALSFILLTHDGGASSFRPEIIRVALHKGADSLKLDGKGVLVTDGAGEPLRLSMPLSVKKARDGINVNGRTVDKVIASAPVSVTLNGKGYRGIIEISQAEGGLLVVNELPLEDYLVGLINCEISSQWPIEAIKAQAVIARSYAIYQKNSRIKAPYHLESSVMDQVYDGCDIEDSRAARGVKETSAEVVTHNRSVIQAFYHSNCGGHTEASENVWGSALPYLAGVDCKYCLAAPSGKWDAIIPLGKVEKQLKAAGIPVTGLKEIRTGARNRSGRLNEVVLLTARGPVAVPAVNFRKALGYTTIKSTNFDIRATGTDISFSGSGYGHGVGLCQWGAKQRAGDGFDYREILSYYYPGTAVIKLDQER